MTRFLHFAVHVLSNTNDSIRHLYDTTLLLTPHDKFNAYINFDYGTEERLTKGRDRWVGVAGAARIAPNGWFALTPHLEFFNDHDGLQTGTRQKLKEFTLTAEFKMKEGFLNAHGVQARLVQRRIFSIAGAHPLSTRIRTRC